jgi:hypothetical protein
MKSERLVSTSVYTVGWLAFSTRIVGFVVNGAA